MGKTYDKSKEKPQSPQKQHAQQRAHAHNDRHHVNADLQEIVEDVNSGLDPKDVVAPAPIYKVEGHHENHPNHQN